jgi:radical SAM protein with 4Fe4S-binding SPASM domain
MSAIIKDFVKEHELLFDISKRILPQKPLPSHYPSTIGIEITTYCDSKCKFCSHEKLIEQKRLKQENIKKEIFEERLLKLKTFVQEAKLDVSLVGMGESLLHPELYSFIKTTQKTFPFSNVMLNTNGIRLDGKTSDMIIRSGLSTLCISIRFNDRESYYKNSGVDKYDVVVDNVMNFLKKKGNKKPDTHLQVFGSINYRQFNKTWKQFLNENDSVTIEEHIDINKCTFKIKDQEFKHRYPCRQPWEMLVVDIDGEVYPCCMGVWYRGDKTLSLGNLDESAHSILRCLNSFRYKHIHNLYNELEYCKSCEVWKQYKKIKQ